jgi:hypothetical protein
MPIEWEDDDSEEPAGSRPEQSEDVWDDESEDEEDGEWIVDPDNPRYEIFVPDEDDDAA